jgi:hypothetical protein
MLEKGSTATNYDVRPYGTELALCQRYYWKTVTNALFVSGYAWASNSTDGMRTTIRHPVTMRATPTITYSDIDYGGTNSLFATANINQDSFVINLRSTSSNTNVWGSATGQGNAEL